VDAFIFIMGTVTVIVLACIGCFYLVNFVYPSYLDWKNCDTHTNNVADKKICPTTLCMLKDKSGVEETGTSYQSCCTSLKIQYFNSITKVVEIVFTVEYPK